ASASAGSPAHDRVDPARARTPADDVGLVAENCRGVVAARGRQSPDSSRRTGRGVDAEDLVELAYPVTAAEFVGERADSDCRTVVEDGRQPTDRPRAAALDRADLSGRGVRGIESAENENPASERRDCR